MAATKPFKHRALDLDQAQIRLFRLLPTGRWRHLAGIIANFDFKDCPEYRAVSYTWGDPSPTRQIHVEGQSLTVRENLWQFLDSARNYTQHWLWIDQICIDQFAADERNHQVSLMARIFAKASRVLVWLGIEANGSSEAMDRINYGAWTIETEYLFRRPYWDRLWVLQEVLLGRNLLVLCGNKSVTWEKLEAFFIPPKCDEDLDWEYPLNINNSVLSLIKEKASFEGQERRLSYVLETFAGLQCQDVRDKVYGLLSLVPDCARIPVSYSKTSIEVFFDTLRRIVRVESFMGFESHCDVAQNLRDKMMLVDITSEEIFEFIKDELGEVKKVNSKDEQGHTPLWLAATKGHEDVVKLLLRKGANLETKEGEYGPDATVEGC
jgi:Heterokaryon incompatibility protein (HET)/Ankyrin repeat